MSRHMIHKMNPNALLVGNTFPMTLIDRVVTINPIGIEEARQELTLAVDLGLLRSFWGHQNTLETAIRMLGCPALRPRNDRIPIILNDERYPGVDGVFAENVLVLSPRYPNGFRPSIGVEVTEHEILGWQALMVMFSE